MEFYLDGALMENFLALFIRKIPKFLVFNTLASTHDLIVIDNIFSEITSLDGKDTTNINKWAYQSKNGFLARRSIWAV